MNDDKLKDCPIDPRLLNHMPTQKEHLEYMNAMRNAAHDPEHILKVDRQSRNVAPIYPEIGHDEPDSSIIQRAIKYIFR